MIWHSVFNDWLEITLICLITLLPFILGGLSLYVLRKNKKRKDG
jgi:amino acid transporter